jgi:hypothetical protein
VRRGDALARVGVEAALVDDLAHATLPVPGPEVGDGALERRLEQLLDARPGSRDDR